MSDATATLDNPADADEPTGPVCSKCDGPMPTEQTTVCPHCGWYASLGVHVEVSQEWEEAAAAEPNTPTAAAPSHLEVWANLIPLWGWLLMGTATVVALGSVAVRVTYPEVGGTRTLWAVTQLIAGLAVAAVCHVVAFLMVAINDPDIGIADIVVSPFKAWRKLLGQLPKRLTIVNTANASVVAAVCAAGVIGGIPYENLLDWNIDAPPEKSLLGAVMDRTKQMGGPEMSMEDAIGSFAGDAAGGNLDGAPDPAGKNTPKNITRQTIDALILGYQLDANGRIAQLLIATERKSKLVYSGRVRPALDELDELELLERLNEHRAPRPIINVPTTDATWVEPRLTCRVSYERRVESGVLTSLLWEKLLSEMPLPW